jgi:uroporphyrinogen-III synthase
VSGPLDGTVVVVTRPERQAAPFLRMLRESGAETVAFPTLLIEPLALDPATRASLEPDTFHWVVYTSTNAVEQGLAQLPRPRRARLAAVGPATARALEAHGHTVHATPATTHDSEGLLAHPELADVRGRRVLILRGVGGREFLCQTLTNRGADVVVAEVYRRVVATPDADALESLERACVRGCAVVAVTSVEVLEALLALAPEPRHATVRDANLLAPGKRVAAAARERGWRGPLIVARSAEDAAMLEALLEWRRTKGAASPA